MSSSALTENHSMASKGIADYEFTTEWLEMILQEKCNTTASIKDVNWTPTGVGMGMLSHIMIVDIDWDSNSEDTVPNSVVFKIPTTKQFGKIRKEMKQPDSGMKKQMEKMNIDEEKFSKANASIFLAHKCEVAVYKLFSRVPPPKELKVPRFYFGRDHQDGAQGILVIEDLSRGKTLSSVQGLNAQQMMEAAKAIAALQAYSLTTDTWKTETINYTFAKTAQWNEHIPSMEQILPVLVEPLKSENQDMFGEIGDKLMEYCKSMDEMKVILKLNQKLNLPDVFCHGDFHAPNLVFSKNDDGCVGGQLIGLIDWQICHPGNLAEDLARCFIASVPAEIRRASTLPALELYYKTLRNHLEKDPHFTFDQVLYCYKHAFKFKALNNMIGLAFLSNNPGFVCKDLTNLEAAKTELKQRIKALIEDVISYCEEEN